MKKFLFTLASLVAFGFAANSAEAVFGFSQNEVTMHAGEELELQIVLQSIDVDVKGFQMDWEMLDPDGTIMPDKCVLEFLQKYGGRTRYQYFGKTGLTTINENTFSSSNGAGSTNAEIIGNNTGHYTLIASNAGTGVCYFFDEETPGNIANFTIQIEEGWDKPYAILTMTNCGLVYPNDQGGEVQGQYFNLKINNGDYQEPATQLPCDKPVITQEVGDDAVTVTITWNQSDGNQVYTGQYSYPRPEYGQPDESYDVEAYTEASENYLESPHAEATINVPAKAPVWQAVDAPVINQSVGDNEVTVTITWPTSTGDKVYTGEYTYTRPAYGEPDQSYEVEAYTTENYPYQESTHATATINVPAKAPVWQAVAAPVISQEVGEDEVTVTITWPTSTGDQVYTGQYTYTRPEYGQPDESYEVEAYTTESYPYQESTHATATINVPAKPEVIVPALKEEDIVIGEVNQTDGTFDVEYIGEVEGVELTVNIAPKRDGAYQLPEQGKWYTVTATASKTGYTSATKTADRIWRNNSEAATAGEISKDGTHIYVPINGNVTKVEVNGVEVELVNGVLVLDREDAAYTPVIVVTTEDEDCNPTTVTLDPITVPAILVAPTIVVSEQTVTQWVSDDDPYNPANAYQQTGQIVTITDIIDNNDSNAPKVYWYTIDGATPAQLFTGDPVPVTGDGEHTITAWVDVDGELTPVATRVVNITHDFTGVNEIVNGKAVANVRYFNMAGQEMTEANGVTIVVTTYTDGTTSAVKVMK